jgi:hypothetical protein
MAASTTRAAFAFGDDSVRENAREIVGFVLRYAEYWEDGEALDEAAAAFRRAATLLQQGDGTAAIADNLDSAFGAEEKLRVVGAFIAPLDASIAAQTVGEILNELIEATNG